MLKIFSVLARALGWLEGLFFGLLGLPLRMFGMNPRPIAPPEIKPLPKLPAAGLTATDLAMSRRREASIVTGYAADVLMHGDAPMPPKLSRAVKDWAAGLRPDELKLLLRAGQDAVFQHISGQGVVTGVPKLTPLPPRKAPAAGAIPRRYEDLHELVPMPAMSILG